MTTEQTPTGIWVPGGAGAGAEPTTERSVDDDAGAQVVERNAITPRYYDSAVAATRYDSAVGYLGAGGMVNAVTGAGTSLDRTKSAVWRATKWNRRESLEVVYNESWACRKFIDIPVDDMTVRWREFDDAGDAQVKMVDQEQTLSVPERLTDAMKAARLYGTALLIIASAEGPLDQPLVPEAVRQDDLVQMFVVDRYHAAVYEYDVDLQSPMYGQPLSYLIDPFGPRGGILRDVVLPDRYATWVRVHHSRVVRFDGIAPLTSNRYSVYDTDWGVSLIVPALKAIIDDHTVAAGVAHLADEASVPVMKITGLGEGYASRARTTPDPDVPTPDEMASMVSRAKSIYRTVFLDVQDEFERVNVSWGGIAEVMNQFAQRLAAIADVPATRFWGRSPMGMNSTGESDMENYAIHVAATQKQMLTKPLKKIDELLARNAGLREPPEYHFPLLVDISEIDLATIAQAKASAVQTAVQAGIITEDDGRSILDGDAVFGDLPGTAPGQPMLDVSPLP